MESISQVGGKIVDNALEEQPPTSGRERYGLCPCGPLPDFVSGQLSTSVPLLSKQDSLQRSSRPKRNTRPPLRFSPPSVTQPKYKRARLLRLDSAGQAIGDTEDFVRQLFGDACTNTQDDLLGLVYNDLEVHLQSSSTI